VRCLAVLALAAACSTNIDGGANGGDANGSGSGSGSGSGVHDAPATPTAVQYCVTETNRYRTTVPPPGTGAPRPPVTESSTLEAYAGTGAMYDFTNGPHAHFMSNSGGGVAFAENECPQQLGWTISPAQSVNDVVAMCVLAFYNGGPGEGHYENMMGSYGSLGCGIYQSGGKITIVQDFGN